MKIVVIGKDGGIEDWLNKLGHEVVVYEGNRDELYKPANPDLVVFTGGADVSPFLYNQANTASSTNEKRDALEVLFYHKFINTTKLGICRGGQFLHVMNGGEMMQDVENHALVGTHSASGGGLDFNYDVTSTHHQQMLPSPYGSVYLQARGKGVEGGIECVYYKNTYSLCFQPHPEYERSLDAEGKNFEKFGTNHCLRDIWSRIFNKKLYTNKIVFGKAAPAAAEPQPAAAFRWEDLVVNPIPQEEHRERVPDMLGPHDIPNVPLLEDRPNGHLAMFNGRVYSWDTGFMRWFRQN